MIGELFSNHKTLVMKPKFFLLAASLVFFVFISKASGNKPCHGKKGDVSGNVINASDKKPLKDVSITAYLFSKKEKVVLTGGCGTYALDDLKPGAYKIVFEKEGFKKVTKEGINVSASEIFQLDIEMLREDPVILMPSPSHFLYN